MEGRGKQVGGRVRVLFGTSTPFSHLKRPVNGCDVRPISAS